MQIYTFSLIFSKNSWLIFYHILFYFQKKGDLSISFCNIANPNNLKTISMKRIFITLAGFIVCMKLMAQSPVGFYPNDNAHNINIDTHLIIEFDQPVKAGSKGIVTVLDKTTNKVVDKIDMSIPAGPTEA